MSMTDQLLLVVALACFTLIVLRVADPRAAAVLGGLCLLFVLIGVIG